MAHVIQYWNNVPQADKQTKVMERRKSRGRFQSVRFSTVGNKGNVRALIYEFGRWFIPPPPMGATEAMSLDLPIDIQFCSSGNKESRPML